MGEICLANTRLLSRSAKVQNAPALLARRIRIAFWELIPSNFRQFFDYVAECRYALRRPHSLARQGFRATPKTLGDSRDRAVGPHFPKLYWAAGLPRPLSGVTFSQLAD